MPAELKNELVLAQNQHAFIQDETKGSVKVHVGPITVTPSGNDRPVKYDAGSRKFVICRLDEAIQQNPTAPEGSYIVLENPTEKGNNPASGTSHSPADLQIGRKVNIQGPIAFALWPGQVATVIKGHQLRSNEYVIVRVYNVAEAKENWPKDGDKVPDDLATGQLLIIKGTDMSFFIPPNGLEVVPDPAATGTYVRKALTLERLEYCILLDENGQKRYEKGPAVVFPEATETFITKDGQAKFKAVELNDQMGLYIKVIADYDDEIDIGPSPISRSGQFKEVLPAPGTIHRDGRMYKLEPHKVGDELFITGKQQRIYYPRAEHAIIEYGSEDGTFKRQRYYGIAIPKGEARYVLNKDTGEVKKVTGHQIFLPDPRHEVIVRRVLDSRTVDLWYPGNQEAKEYNESLQQLAVTSLNYVADTNYKAAVDLQRSMNRGTRGSSAIIGAAGATTAQVVGNSMQRATSFTPPPSVTLNTKYDGVPMINIWTGYAVQVVDKDGKRRVVKGPNTLLLEYDETLEVITLSTGKPKTTDNLIRDCYLRVDNNLVSDIVTVETKDMVLASIKVSYRVNFEGDSSKWFSVENYVKFLCDHLKSMLRSEVKKKMIKELIDNSAEIVRDTVLGVKGEKAREGRIFKENDMRVYDVEVLGTKILDPQIEQLLMTAQKLTVQHSLELVEKESELEILKKKTEVIKQIQEFKAEAALNEITLNQKIQKANSTLELESVINRLILEKKKLDGEKEAETARAEMAATKLSQRKESDAQNILVAESETSNFTRWFAAMTPDLIKAIQTLSDTEIASAWGKAVAPLAIMEQQGIGNIISRLLKGTPLEGKVASLTAPQKTNGSTV